MSGDFAVALAWAVSALAFFSFMAIAAWTDARRKEREALYKSEAIRKIAEIQGTPSEPVLAMLREALEKWADTNALVQLARENRRGRFRTEALGKIAGGADKDTMLELIREDDRRSRRRTREGLKLTGMITAAVGIGLTACLYVLVQDMPVYLVGLIPGLVGAALLGYGFLVAPQD